MADRNCFIIPILCLLMILESCIPLQFEAEDHSGSVQREKGKKKLDEISNTAEYSTCWKEALDGLHSSCRKMSDNDQRRLALAFTNCHFESSNRGTYPCPKNVDISECTSTEKMDDAAFHVYTEFFTHSNNICYFLQSLLWQEKTETTINKLSDASEVTVEKLEESLKYHKKLEAKQTLSLKNQEVILEQDHKISQTLENTKSNMDRAFEEMYAKAESQKLLLDDVLGTLKSGMGSIQWILSSILGEIITLETAGFFIGIVIVITFFPQFGTSRLWLFGVLLIYAVLEGVLKRAFFSMVDISQPDSMSSLHSYLWYSRCFAVVLLVSIFYWRYISFTGHERQQESLLKDMSQQLHLIKQSLPSTPHPNTGHNRSEYEEEDTDSQLVLPFGSSSDEEPCTIPLDQYYNKHNNDSNIVSGTQLVDFLSGIYIKNSIKSLPDIELSTTTALTDDTYRPDTDTDSDIDNTTIDTDITSLTRTTLSRSNIRRRYLTTPSPTPPPLLFDPVPVVSSNESFVTAQSHVSLDHNVPPTNICPTHTGSPNSSIIRESTPVTESRKRQRKRMTPRPRFNYPRHVEDDDSGFSTDGTHGNRSIYPRYNLRPRSRQSTTDSV